MSNETPDHAQRIAEIEARLDAAADWTGPELFDALRYLIACVRELEPYRHALEQRLIGSNMEGLTGNADADLMRFVFHENELALSPEVGTIAELRDALTAAIARAERAEGERDTLRAIVSEVAGAIGNGAFCLPTASLEFMGKIPEEVLGVVNALRALNVACGDSALRIGRELDAAQKALGDAQAENLSLRAQRDDLIQASGDLCPECHWRGVRDDGCDFCAAVTLRTQRDAALAELSRLGEPIQECSLGGRWSPCDLGKDCMANHRRTIRVVQPEKEQQP